MATTIFGSNISRDHNDQKKFVIDSPSPIDATCIHSMSANCDETESENSSITLAQRRADHLNDLISSVEATVDESRETLVTLVSNGHRGDMCVLTIDSHGDDHLFIFGIGPDGFHQFLLKPCRDIELIMKIVPRAAMVESSRPIGFVVSND